MPAAWRSLTRRRSQPFSLQAPVPPPINERFQFGEGISVDGNAALSLVRAPDRVPTPSPDDSCAPPIPDEAEAPSDLAPALASLKPLGQIRDSFILAVNPEGLWIVDQHVAHERVLFEKILKQRAAQKVESQRLLMPLVIELTPAQQAVFTEISDELAKNGFEVEPFGARSVAMKIAPAGIEARAVEHMLHELLDQFSREEQASKSGKNSRPHRRLHRLPCRHQGQHAARAKQNGMAAGGTGQNRLPHVLPARAAGRSAILDERYSEGV